MTKETAESIAMWMCNGIFLMAKIAEVKLDNDTVSDIGSLLLREILKKVPEFKDKKKSK